jgi:hypothetical protein
MKKNIFITTIFSALGLLATSAFAFDVHFGSHGIGFDFGRTWHPGHPGWEGDLVFNHEITCYSRAGDGEVFSASGFVRDRVEADLVQRHALNHCWSTGHERCSLEGCR